MLDVNERVQRTVLILAHECAPHHRPESSVGAQRPAQFAKYLPEFGWRAIVVCCDSARRRKASREDLGQIAASVKRALRDADPASSVIVATPSMSCDGLLDRFWWSLASAGKRSPLTDLTRKALTVAKYFAGDYSQSWQPCARAAAAAIAAEVSIDCCIGEHSPDAGIFLARWFSSTYGVPWVADFRDPILQPLTPIARRLYRPIAKRLLKTAKSTVNVNRVLVEMDHQMFGRPAWSIPNGFDPSEFHAAGSSERSERFTIAYAGNIISAQRLEIFFEGLAILKGALGTGAPKEMVFVYRGFSWQRVAGMAEAADVADLVDVAGYIERDKVLGLLEAADLLLLLSIAHTDREDAYLTKGLYPAKVFEYFGARRPIICVPGDGGLLDELIEETGTGVIARSPDEIAGYLKHAIAEWKSGRSLEYQPNELAVSKYTRRSLARRMAAVLNHAVGLVPERTESGRAGEMLSSEKDTLETSRPAVATHDALA